MVPEFTIFEMNTIKIKGKRGDELLVLLKLKKNMYNTIAITQ